MEIEKKLRENLTIEYLEIINNSYLHKGHIGYKDSNDTHFEVIIKSPDLKNLSKIEAHRKINRILKEEFSIGLHALEIKIID